MNTSTQPQYASKPLRVLIVEDSEFSRKLLGAIFDGKHKTYGASTIQEGWNLYLDQKPDIVFLDISLPDGNGHDLAKKIKEHNPATYIVMATASHAIKDKVSAAHNQVDGFTIKPFRKKEIEDQVEKYLASLRDMEKRHA